MAASGGRTHAALANTAPMGVRCARWNSPGCYRAHLADEQLALAASVFENSLNGVIITDAQARIMKANQAFSRILGYSADEVLGEKTACLNRGHHKPPFYRTLWEAIEWDGHWQGDIWDRRKDGRVIPLWQSISSVQDGQGGVKNYISVFYDLSDQKRSAEHIHHLAYYDALTDLPNRQLFNERCKSAAGCLTPERQAAVFAVSRSRPLQVRQRYPRAPSRRRASAGSRE